MKPITSARILYLFLAAFIFAMIGPLLNLLLDDTPIRFTPTTLLILPGIALVLFLSLIFVGRLIRRLKGRGGWWTRFRLLWLENSLFFFLVFLYIDISDLLLESGASDFNLLATLVGTVVGGLLGGFLLAWATPKDEAGEPGSVGDGVSG